MGYAEFKGKSFPERYICKRSCFISCTGALFHLRYWEDAFIHCGSFSIGYSHLLADCDNRYMEKGERRITMKRLSYSNPQSIPLISPADLCYSLILPIGILYEITQALTDHGCNISFSRISTLGNRIVDVFYVQDEWGEKIEAKQKVDNLKQTLLSRLTPPDNIS